MHLVQRFCKARIPLSKYIVDIWLFQPAVCRADKVSPQNCPFARASANPYRKRHLDRFSRFCAAQDCDWTTDRQTDRQTTLLCLYNNRPHLHSSEMRPNKKLCHAAVTDGTNQLHNISQKFILSIYISLRTFWTPLVHIFMRIATIW